MPFRPSFECLWCGRPHETRAATDLEGWAQLCPDCLGRAGDNEFLRFRLRRALEERGAAGGRTASAEPAPADEAPAVEEDWLLRRGRFAHGPIHDAAWAAELDAAGRWLDELPLGGRILLPAPGSGWWAPLLATHGELTVLDSAAGPLDRTRERLVAHRLEAHLHLADPWSPAGAGGDPPADVVVIASRLGGLSADALTARLAGVRSRLRPGGQLAAIDPLAEPRSGGVDGSPAPAAPVAPGSVEAALRAAGFGDIEVSTSGRFFILTHAIA